MNPPVSTPPVTTSPGATDRVTTNRSVVHTVQERPDGSRVEYDDIPIIVGSMWEEEEIPKLHRYPELANRPVEEVGTLFKLMERLFVDSWDQVMFGPCVEGAVFELCMREKPEKISMLDGYLTVFFDKPAHFHLCIGPHRGLGRNRTHPDVARHRQCARAAFQRTVQAGCSPQSWGISLWNGQGEQMVTFFLPSPFLNEQQNPRKEPDWGRLKLWNDLRAEFLGETQPQALPSGTPHPGH